MSDQLYTDLGIKRDADAKSIRKAYIRKVKKHHPDKGGNAASFYKIQKAYDVLSDPDRRAHYDATGDSEDRREPSTKEDKAAQVLRQLMDELLFSQLTEERADTIDLLKEICGALTQRMDKMRRAQDEGRKSIAALEKLEKRLVRRRQTGPDVLGEMIAARLVEARGLMLQLADEGSVLSLARDMLRDYEFARGKASAPDVWAQRPDMSDIDSKLREMAEDFFGKRGFHGFRSGR